MQKSIKKFIHLLSNIRNWPLYSFYKERRHTQILKFITRPQSLELLVDSENYAIFKEIFIEDFYKLKKIIKELGDEPLIIDIGANRGLFCAAMLNKKAGSKIFAFEPLKENVFHFEKFLALNSKQTQNVHLFQKAVTGNGEKRIKIFKGSDELGSIASVYQDFDIRNTDTIQVEAISLNEIINEINEPYIDLLKMDCEGSEYPILYNSPKETLLQIHTLLIEVHDLDQYNRNAASLEQFLKQTGFIVSTEKFNNECYLMTAKNISLYEK